MDKKCQIKSKKAHDVPERRHDVRWKAQMAHGGHIMSDGGIKWRAVCQMVAHNVPWPTKPSWLDSPSVTPSTVVLSSGTATAESRSSWVYRIPVV